MSDAYHAMSDYFYSLHMLALGCVWSDSTVATRLLCELALEENR